MAGIPLGSSFRLTSPIPLLLNAVFANEAARFAAGQLRHTAWDYHQTDEATYWRIKPRNQCFIGSTPATQAGTWGTIADHWIEQGTGSGGGAAITKLTPVTITSGMVQSDGSVQVPLPTDATGLLDLRVSQIAPGTDTSGTPVSLDDRDWSIASGVLTIVADANVLVGDVLMGSYYTVSPGSSSPGSGTPVGTPRARQVRVESGGNDSTGAIGVGGSPYLTLTAACLALGANGGVIDIGVGSFDAPAQSVIPNGIWFKGSGIPSPADNSARVYPVVNTSGLIVFSGIPTRLLGGTIIKGTLNCGLRDNITLTDLGVDTGSAWCAARPSPNAGVAAEGLLFAQNFSGGFTSPDSIHPLQADSRQRSGCVIHNVISLCKDASSGVHAGLFENLIGPRVTNFTAIFGTHGIVFKTVGAIASNLHSYGHQANAAIIKGNFYAFNQHNTITNLTIGCVVAGDTGGVRLSNGDGDAISSVSDLSLSHVKVVGASYGLVNENTNLDRLNLTDIAITGAVDDGFKLSGFQRSTLENITVTGSGGKGFVLNSNDTRNKVTNLNAFDNVGVGMQLDASIGYRLDVSGLTSIGNTGSIAYGSNRVVAWGRIVVDTAPIGTPTVGSGTVVLGTGGTGGATPEPGFANLVMVGGDPQFVPDTIPTNYKSSVVTSGVWYMSPAQGLVPSNTLAVIMVDGDGTAGLVAWNTSSEERGINDVDYGGFPDPGGFTRVGGGLSPARFVISTFTSLSKFRISRYVDGSADMQHSPDGGSTWEAPFYTYVGTYTGPLSPQAGVLATDAGYRCNHPQQKGAV